MDSIKSMMYEFKKFISKGNVIDLSVGIIIGASFSKIVSSLVADIIMPLIGLIMGKINFTTLFISLDANHYDTLELAKKAQAPLLMYGNFIQTIVDFLIVGFAIFIVVKLVNKANSIHKKEIIQEPTTKSCDECFSTIHIKAKTCPNCRCSQIK